MDAMELQHLEVRLPVIPADGFDAGEAIPVFHDWVRRQPTGELLIDVADYRHVPGGPGVLLVGHEADYALAVEGSGAALRYQRKAPVTGSSAQRLGQALGAALRAARMLKDDPALAGRLRYGLDGLQVVVNDRLLAPNTPGTAAVAVPALEAWLAGALGHEDFSLVWDSEPRHRFGVTLRSSEALDAAAVLGRLGTS